MQRVLQYNSFMCITWTALARKNEGKLGYVEYAREAANVFAGRVDACKKAFASVIDLSNVGDLDACET